jgi:alanine racemase
MPRTRYKRSKMTRVDSPQTDVSSLDDVRPVSLEVDLDALRANYAALRKLVPPETKLIASIKANAYGHGVVEVGRVLEELGADALATGSFEDAVALRGAGVKSKLLLFACQLPEASGQLLAHDVIPTVYNLETARAVSASATAPTPVYVKVECGLGRFGVDVSDAAAFVQAVASLPNVVVEGLYTHSPFDDAPGRAWALERLAEFRVLRDSLADAGLQIPVTQALSSAGVVAGLDDLGCTAVCPGRLLYGLVPVTPDVADCSEFRPVLRALRTRLIHVAQHARSRPAGMSGKDRFAAGTTIGVVPVGLVDGYRPARAGVAEMLLRGRRVPVLRTSLEATTLDLTDVPDPELGEPVVALGEDGSEGITLEDVATWQGTSALEVLMTFSGRMPITHPTER